MNFITSQCCAAACSAALLTAGCGNDNFQAAPGDLADELMFQTGFGGTTISTRTHNSDTLDGVDTTLPDRADWSHLEDGLYISQALVYYEAGTSGQRYAAVSPDPQDTGNPVLQFRILEPHIVEGDHMKGRVDCVLQRLQGLPSVSQHLRLYLHPDLATLALWSKKITWLIIFEFWGGTDLQVPSDRVTVTLYKPEGAVDALRFRVSASHWNLVHYVEQWAEVAHDYPIPCGRWMNLELSIATVANDDGRFFMAVSDAQTPRTVLFDLTRRMIPQAAFSKINPMKLYTSDELITYMRTGGKNLSLYWDDWKLYRNHPLH